MKCERWDHEICAGIGIYTKFTCNFVNKFLNLSVKNF